MSEAEFKREIEAQAATDDRLGLPSFFTEFLQRRKDASGEPSKPNRPKPEGSKEPSGVGRSASLTRSAESRAIRQP